VLRSAVANAEHNYQVRNLDDLRVVRAIADGGPMLKRIQPRAMGRAFAIKHRTSHLTIGVSDETNGGTRPAAPAPRPSPPPRAEAPAPARRAPRRGAATGGRQPRARTGRKPKGKE
jgi:Ribosomal protein L22p/L17e